jgi:hypothetical protein
MTTLIDTGLLQYYPLDIPRNLNVWVYGTTAPADASPADTTNRGVERRAQKWTAATTTVTLYAPGMPEAITTGHYEIHQRFSRARKLAAINSALHRLGLSWYRPVLDETLETAADTYRYTLPSGTPWAAISDVQVQISTNAGLVGYPFLDAAAYNWRVESQTDASGVVTWYLRFGTLPPAGRDIRLYGLAGYADLTTDASILPLGDPWAGAAQEFIYQWAAYQLFRWEGHAMPAGQIDRIRIWSREEMQDALGYLLAVIPTPRGARIIVPGRGDGQPVDNDYHVDYFTGRAVQH